jgi:L-2-hydroxyglutarate oxidase
MRGDPMDYEFTVVGAGIVGAATSLELIRRRPRARILLIEKETGPARHQSGRNSGVVHAGVYYEPGSLKARFCREGVEATRAFCHDHQLPYETIGKLIVATSETERTGLDTLFNRCRENGLTPRMLDAQGLREMEPNIVGAGAIMIGETGITDYTAICSAMIEEFRQRGGEIRFGEAVTGIEEHEEHIALQAGDRTVKSRRLVVCGGLMADRLARMQGLNVSFRTVPYRGEYYRLRPELAGLIKHLIYPVPDPALPFLGVHLTRTVSGEITVGPNAVQSFRREGYRRPAFSLRDTADMLAFPGWWKLTSRHFSAGLAEAWNSAWKRGYLAQVQKYCPQIALDDLLPHPPGVRAQAVSRDGVMIHDFLLEQTPRSLHVCNAPSPAATSAIPISRHVCSMVLDR